MLYPYTSDLLCLEFCHLQDVELPAGARGSSDTAGGPAHSNRTQTERLHATLSTASARGSESGYTARRHSGQRQRMSSARLHPEVITDYLRKELTLGRLLGPFPGSLVLPNLHINRFGVIPKGHSTSLAYTTVDQVAEVVARLGTAALLAKVDIESAYRLIPVHPQDRPLQAVRWEGQVFIDPMLPFGLRSAPKIFNAVAEALNWLLHQRGIPHVLHYLDDFIIISPPHLPQGQESLSRLRQLWGELGVPISEHKTDGPTTCLVFLGFEIDTVTGKLRLPGEKLQRLQALLRQWGDRKVCSRKDLESLVGMLNHACKVVRAGRSFLRRMIDLLHAGPTTRPCPDSP